MATSPARAFGQSVLCIGVIAAMLIRTLVHEFDGARPYCAARLCDGNGEGSRARPVFTTGGAVDGNQLEINKKLIPIGLSYKEDVMRRL